MHALALRPLAAAGRRFSILVATASLVLGGCAQWKEAPEPPTKRGLPAATVADEAAVLDVIFWPVPLEIPGALSEPIGAADQTATTVDPLDMLWREVDELAVPADTRQHLINNGLRAGRIEHIEQWIERIGLPQPADASEQLMQQAAVSSEIAHSRHRIPFRNGQPQDFAIRQTAAGNQSVLVRSGSTSHGRSLEQPQFLLTVQTHPEPDSRVRVRTWPRIEHGPFRQSYVSNDQAIRMNSRRDSWPLHELAIELALDQNQTLIVAPARDAFGLGKQLLTDVGPDGSKERVVILIRLARKPQPKL
ncbi:hypothetical protein [Roseimaritima sediminicola]|uniref:hypothetical protein n=1 Tax=Roseimaritima sediminicola TaxID=2662066 RepID=UPI001386FA81|nr:hypothetical protein [Roseimaritima sediminicola]